MGNPEMYGIIRPIFSTTTVLSCLFLVRLLSAKFATIPDCDEVFNYWEPTHYLAHNYGLQTWEYSPEYAIRSWAYVGLHAAMSRWISWLPNLSKVHEFYGLRCIFAFVCAFCETRLYTAVSVNVSRKIGLLYLIFTMTSAGMFNASTAFIPSTFAMYTTMLGMAAFLDMPARGAGLKTVQGVFWFAVGGLLGWPFSMVMVVPFLASHLLVGVNVYGLAATVGRFVKAGIVGFLVLGVITAVDSWAYKKMEIVSLNIILYNVFGGEGKGPNIYGTEPWWFYLANLALNFNILLPLALLSIPLLMLTVMLPTSSTESPNPITLLTLLAPSHIWLIIFIVQPHKEERFMFPAYPAFLIAASISFHFILSIWGSLVSSSAASTIIPKKLGNALNWALLVLPITISTLLSVSRTMAVVSGYSAPMHMYDPEYLPVETKGNLCLGKEWYRFPSSYFLPDGVRARFVKSEFDGLLPGQFDESGVGSERPGIWNLPDGMNDLNKEDMSKYVDISTCDYFVDSYFPSSPSSSSVQPDYMLDHDHWTRIHCESFLDAAASKGMLGRAFWAPGGKQQWGAYCLLKKKDWVEEVGDEEKSEEKVPEENSGEL